MRIDKALIVQRAQTADLAFAGRLVVMLLVAAVLFAIPMRVPALSGQTSDMTLNASPQAQR